MTAVITDPGLGTNGQEPDEDQLLRADLGDQLSLIVAHVLDCERWARTEHHVDLVCGIALRLPDAHRCQLPAVADSFQAFECPRCRARWVSGWWQHFWKPYEEHE